MGNTSSDVNDDFGIGDAVKVPNPTICAGTCGAAITVGFEDNNRELRCYDCA